MQILLQNIWELKADWDEQVPPIKEDTWIKWRQQLHYLTEFPIARYYYKPNSSVKDVQLRGFSDASEQAFAAVVYLRA